MKILETVEYNRDKGKKQKQRGERKTEMRQRNETKMEQ